MSNVPLGAPTTTFLVRIYGRGFFPACQAAFRIKQMVHWHQLTSTEQAWMWKMCPYGSPIKSGWVEWFWKYDAKMGIDLLVFTLTPAGRKLMRGNQ